MRNAKVLLLECTFVEPDHRDRARAGYHIHARDLREWIPRLNNEKIVLSHLSHRTALAEAKALLRRELGEELMQRVVLLMEHRLRRSRRSSAPPNGQPKST